MKKGNRIGIIITLGLMMCSFQVAAQKWKPLGNGIPEKIQATCTDTNNNLYVAYTVDTFVVPFGSKIYIVKWNGTTWTNLPNLLAYGYGLSKEFKINLCIFKNELYLGGDFDSIKGIESGSGILRYDGSKWNSVNPTSYYRKLNLTKMIVFQGKLYVIGVFSKINNIVCNNIASWDGITWKALGDLTREGFDGKPNDLIIYNSKLFIAGSFTRVGNWTDTFDMAVWNGSILSGKHSPLDSIILFGTYQNLMLLCSKNEIFFWDGSNLWTKISVLNDININYKSWNNYNTIEYKNEIWLCSDTIKFKGISTIYNIIIWDGNTWSPYPGIKYHSNIGKFIDNFEILNGKLIATGNFDSLNGVLCNNIAMLDLKVGKIGGKVYYDSNNNCVKDTNERGIASNLIEIQPGSHYASTDENGKYEAYIDTGNITINHVPDNGFYKYWRLSACNPLNYNIHVGLTTNDTNNNFGLVPFTNIKDISISLNGESGFMARPGRTENYTISYENIGTATISTGSVNLTLDSNVNLQTAYPNYTTYTKPYASWTFNNLSPGENRMINLKIRIDTTLSIFDTLIFCASIQPTTDEADLPNNYDTLKQKIVTAIDPNDKQCSPDGNIIPQTSQIDYLIRFQNTGNYPAYRVRVVDTVSENLPMTMILIKPPSHPFKLQVKDNVLTWTFNDIMLPDSFTDEPKSHGFIRYTAYIKPGLAIGTKINNTAYIYFDYQQPVATNSTINTLTKVDNPEKPPIIGNKYYKVYPNPTTGYLIIEYLGTSDYSEIILYNTLGKEMKRIKVVPKSLLKLDTGSFPAGIYILRDVKGQFTNKVMVNY
jgi:hypothetical protein